VLGPGDAGDELRELAATAGRLIAQRGAVLVCGGLGGVMEAAAAGAAQAGGLSLGILPGADRAQANPHLTIALSSGLGELRNGLVIAAADAALAIGGSWGTVSEVALARRAGLPVAWVAGWRIEGGDGVAVAASPAEGIELLFGTLRA
jgi:uncharacterized protein (TIGR00725 family)